MCATSGRKLTLIKFKTIPNNAAQDIIHCYSHLETNQLQRLN
jgi:hypothetical protein